MSNHNQIKCKNTEKSQEIQPKITKLDGEIIMSNYYNLCKESLRNPFSMGSIIPGMRTLNFWSMVKRWKERSHQRKQLAQLDTHLRTDIGLSDDQIEMETAKPFWEE